MGMGDEIMATGLARGAAARGKQIAFGDGKRLIWSGFCEEAFRYNPNIARRVGPNVEWMAWYKGCRWTAKPGNQKWIWNYDFKAKPGEFYFDEAEKTFATRRPMAVLLEPNMPWKKPITVNKDWGAVRWQQLVDMLKLSGIRVFQTSHGPVRLAGVYQIQVSTFRQAAAAISGFSLVIVAEGGLHHAARDVADLSTSANGMPACNSGMYRS
jgi:hypothetical protein